VGASSKALFNVALHSHLVHQLQLSGAAVDVGERALLLVFNFFGLDHGLDFAQHFRPLLRQSLLRGVLVLKTRVAGGDRARNVSI
jgi:hypothetical protein